MTSGEPAPQMPACRMSERNHMRKIEIVLRRDNAQVVNGFSRIKKRLGPAAAVANPPVFDVPRGDALCAKCFTQMPVVFQPVLRAPVSAMDADDDRVRSCSRWHAQVAELLAVCAIGDARIGCIGWARQDFHIRSLSMVSDEPRRRTAHGERRTTSSNRAW